MVEPRPNERRRYVRLEQSYMLRHEKYVFDLTGERELVEEGKIRDYSLGGAMFESRVKYSVGDVLKLAISIRGWERYKNEFYKDDKTSRREPVIVLAKVVRAQAMTVPGVYGIAVEFIGIDEGDHWNLMKHIKAQLEKKDKP